MPGDDDLEAMGGERGLADARRQVDLLYRDHATRLRRRLRARVQSPDEANDLVQDAFARLLGARRLDGLRKPEAFLNRILRNLLIDRSRRAAARPPHVEYQDEHDLAVRADQGDAIEVEQMRQRYMKAVAALPDRMREVFLLHRVDQLSYVEIANRLGISIRTVEWHVAEAIVRIGKGLDPE